MPFSIERNDMAKVSADAVVIAANEGLQINGGVGLAVARAAGLEQMQAACDALGGCPVGSAVATPSFALADHGVARVVHVVGPVWQGGALGEDAVLRAAYDSALACAADAGARSIALPLVSAHTFGFPVRMSFVIAVEAIKSFLETHEADVKLVLYGEDAMAVGVAFFGDIAEYIDDHYVEQREPSIRMSQSRWSAEERPMQAPSPSQSAFHGSAEGAWVSRFEAPSSRGADGQRVSYGAPVPSNLPQQSAPRGQGIISRLADAADELRERIAGRKEADERFDFDEQAAGASPSQTGEFAPIVFAEPTTDAWTADEQQAVEPDGGTFGAPAPAPMSASFAGPSSDFAGNSLAEWLDQLDESFSTTLLALIDERGFTDAEVYKRANMSRQLFSKIRSDVAYRPTKKTVLALAIALGLDLGATCDLLERAGFALSHSNKADVIVEYFIVNGKYDIFAINEALYAFDQPLL